MKDKIKIFKNIEDVTFNGSKDNVLFVTGLSGSGKSYLAKKLADDIEAKVFQIEWLIHYKHCDKTFKKFLDEFIDKYNIRDYVNRKWDNEKCEDDNVELKRYINLLVKEFIDSRDEQKYIVEGLQLFTLVDFDLIKDYYIIVKGTSSINSLKNRIKRDYFKRKKYKLLDKAKWFVKVIKQSKTYQFKHRKKLNEFMEEFK
jgi:ABC-type dipeptide/oligopeptide/nickel transport system ATPase component